MNREVGDMEVKEFFGKAAEVLLWCFWFSLALIVISAAAYLAIQDSINNIHGSVFGLSGNDIALTVYGSLAYAKVSALMFFLFPSLAIRMVLRKG